MSDGNGRIELIGRKPRDKGSDLCTNAKAQQIAVNVCEYYMNQVPGLVAHMIKEALKASGVELQPPPTVASDQDLADGAKLAASADVGNEPQPSSPGRSATDADQSQADGAAP